MLSRFFPPSFTDECNAILPIDPVLTKEAQDRLDILAKPLGSLGRLEDMARQLYGIQKRAPLETRPSRMYTIAGDHGVVEEGVASSPKAVTVSMTQNFLQGGAAINCICAVAGMEFRVVDAGMDHDPLPEHSSLINAKVARGTANIATGPAMTRDECLQALQLGLSLAEAAYKDGVRVIGTGEMGIGNTTSSSALCCAYFGFSADEMTGMGAGIPKAGLSHKAKIIEKALHNNVAAVASGDPFVILSTLGGLEIATLTGLIIGSAARRMAILIDGFISTAAFVAAWKMVPYVKDYCFFCHGSAEAGHAKVLQAIGQKPLLDLDMRLGEGTGAALGFMLLEAAVKVYNDMATFESAGVSIHV